MSTCSSFCPVSLTLMKRAAPFTDFSVRRSLTRSSSVSKPFGHANSAVLNQAPHGLILIRRKGRGSPAQATCASLRRPSLRTERNSGLSTSRSATVLRIGPATCGTSTHATKKLGNRASTKSSVSCTTSSGLSKKWLAMGGRQISVVTITDIPSELPRLARILRSYYYP